MVNVNQKYFKATCCQTFIKYLNLYAFYLDTNKGRVIGIHYNEIIFHNMNLENMRGNVSM